jgi:hypothetical protein
MITTYPNAPGWKDKTVSRDNALRIGEERCSLRMKELLGLFRSGFTGTADEAGEILGLTPFQVRPVCTMLRQLKLIERTGELKVGAGGGEASVLRSAP